MAITPELQSVVAKATQVFARYSLNGRITVCNCPSCVAPEIERELIRTPLHQVSRALLAQYTHSAHGWDGKVAEDFRYFLPRYFELIARDEAPSHTSLEACLARLSDAAYAREWPKAEAAVVDEFFAALFRARLHAANAPGDMGLFERGEEAEAVLCCAANAGSDIGPLLDIWDESVGRDADVRLARMVVSADWLKRRLSNSWWLLHDRADVRDAMDRIVAWLSRETIRARLEAACLREADPVTALLLSQAEATVGRGMK